MIKKTTVLIVFLLVALIVSISYNFMLHNQLAVLQNRIDRFIPAAQELEAENTRLRALTTAQQDKLKELANPLSNKIAPEVQPLPAPPTPQEQNLPLPEPNNFRDLNKKHED